MSSVFPLWTEHIRKSWNLLPHFGASLTPYDSVKLLDFSFRLGWPCASEQLSISPGVSLWGSKLWPGQLWTGLHGSGAGRIARGSSSPRLAHGICSHRDRDTAESLTVVTRVRAAGDSFFWSGRLKTPEIHQGKTAVSTIMHGLCSVWHVACYVRCPPPTGLTFVRLDAAWLASKTENWKLL